MKPVVVHAPAKLNLFLAITGRRPDGFHDLVSLVAPVQFGDTLRVETADEFSLSCDDPAVPVDETNLVLKAASAFAKAMADKKVFATAANWRGGAKFTLEKRIPMGAGLGGGSSDGVAALRALNMLAGQPLDAPELAELAAKLGSDCALFLHDAPVIMRGRGERIQALPAGAVARLRGQRVLIFKPGFGVATPWAYQAMAAQPATYLAAASAEARLAAWIGDERATAGRILFNNMESVAFAKFVALPALLEKLRADFALEPRMSGSGSACFALLPEGKSTVEITPIIRAAWGESAFIAETVLA